MPKAKANMGRGMEVEGKEILVVGFGVSGQAAAELLRSRGARVSVIDHLENEEMKRRARRKKNAGIHFQFGMKAAPQKRFDAAIVSPGVSLERGLGRSVVDLDIPVFGELEMASWYCQCPIIAITGTNGKTTTTELVERVLKSCRKKAMAAGNIGRPLSEAVIKSDKLQYMAVEVSSFQLETIETFRPHVSVMMNITPDHLDRYISMEEYAKAKAALWKNQTAGDFCVVNVDTERLLAGLGFHLPGQAVRYSIRGEKMDLWFDGENFRGPVVEKMGLTDARLDQTQLRGLHNAENVMATLATAFVLGLDPRLVWKSICSYQPLRHRLETVGILDGVEFVNDSKATNIDAMEKALSAFTRPIILIAGGKDKGFDFSGLIPLIRGKVRACLLIGEMKERIFEVWKETVPCHMANSLEDAVHLSRDLSREGDVVLLSPGCSSYDMFENYEDRGDTFKRTVHSLGVKITRGSESRK
jgi:UDP-N-acetylmuramoylalanine--D-glutamate ligase